MCVIHGLVGLTPDLVATAWVGFDDNNRRLGSHYAQSEFESIKTRKTYNYMGNALLGSESGCPCRATRLDKVYATCASG